MKGPGAQEDPGYTCTSPRGAGRQANTQQLPQATTSEGLKCQFLQACCTNKPYSLHTRDKPKELGKHHNTRRECQAESGISVPKQAINTPTLLPRQC